MPAEPGVPERIVAASKAHPSDRPDPQARVERWVRPAIRSLSAYHVPPARGLIKLDAMENPYGWPPALVDQWLEVLRGAELNRYPDPSAARLTARLREVMDVPQTAGLLLGNGSDEIIQMIALCLADATAEPARVVLAPEPSFVMYRMIAAFTGMDYVGVPLDEDFSLDPGAMRAAIEQHEPAVVFLAYPNNPTGNLFDAEAVRAVIEAAPGLVVVDEAYHAFAGESFLGAVGDYDNLLVMRTVSKMGLAGLRLGLLAGPAAWLDEIDKVRLPYNINVLTQLSAEFALRHADVLAEQSARIRAEREALSAALNAMAGLRVYPSRANFILFRVPAGRAGDIFGGLREAGILIKNLDGAGGPLRDCLRVTVGTPEENAAFLDALRGLL